MKNNKLTKILSVYIILIFQIKKLKVIEIDPLNLILLAK